MVVYGPAGPELGHADVVEYRLELRGVAALPGRRSCSPVSGVTVARPYRRDGESVERAVAFDPARREMILRAQLASVRAVRAQLVRGLVGDAGEAINRDTDPVKMWTEYAVEDCNELAVLVAEHRRTLGELL